MSRSRFMLLLAVLAIVGLTAPSAVLAAGEPVASGAAAKKKAKKCKAGQKRVTVGKGKKKRSVCRKKATAKKKAAAPAPSGPAGPSVAEVETIIRELAQANHKSWVGPESMVVTFERPTQVGSMVMYDPYEGDPLHAGGPIEAWPVRAWVKVVSNHDTTPEDDVNYAGCLGHLNSWWPYDSLHMFYRDQTGAWAFRTSSAKPGDC